MAYCLVCDVTVLLRVDVVPAFSFVVAIEVVEAGWVISLTGLVAPLTYETKLMASFIRNSIPVLIFSPLLVALGVDPLVAFRPLVRLEPGMGFKPHFSFKRRVIHTAVLLWMA